MNFPATPVSVQSVSQNCFTVGDLSIIVRNVPKRIALYCNIVSSLIYKLMQLHYHVIMIGEEWGSSQNTIFT